LVFTEDASCKAAIVHWATGEGFDADVAADEQEARTRLLSGEIDVFFTSRLWPKDGPLPTLGALKADKPNTRIVYIPAPSDEIAMVPLARAAGVHAVLRQPLDRIAVLQQIETAVVARAGESKR